MFCENCGSQIPESSSVCPNCGAAVRSAGAAQPVQPTQPVYQPVQPVYQQPVQPVYSQPVYAQPTPVTPVGAPAMGAMNPELAKSVLVMGIVAVATACTVWFSFLGIIFGAIGLSKAKKFTEECGQLFGKARIGKYLSLGGLIGGAVISGYVLITVVSTVLTAIAESR